MSEEARRARAEARSGRTVLRRTILGREDAVLEGTPEERVLLAIALTRAAWAMTGEPWPAAGASRSIVRFVPRAAG